MVVAGPKEKDTCREYVLPALRAAGWRQEQVLAEYPITDGRIIPTGRKHRRGRQLRADYLLELRPGVPVAVVEAKRLYRNPADGLQQAKQYAGLLDLPLAYSTNGKGIVEDDRDTGKEAFRATFPSPDEAWRRYKAWKGITRPEVADTLLFPFNRELRTPSGEVKEPRYYQRIAIHRALEAVLSGRKRLLLTLATGTGKTFVAQQIVWKLWNSDWLGHRKPRVLYLADRNILVDQPIEREFRPVFGDAIWKIQGEKKTGREIYFALYQALADSGTDPTGIFRNYPRDYFDLVIVDECHRGSASEESSWREILHYFVSAAHLGMTATPKRQDNVDTYKYFGDPLYQGNVIEEPPSNLKEPPSTYLYDALPPDDPELEEGARKYYVGETEVYLTAEAVYQLDPDQERLRLVEYRDYVADVVRTVYLNPSVLRSKWRNRPGRQEVVDTLGERGIDFEEAVRRTGLADVDPFDLLVHVAWNEPLATRHDRARRVRKERADFFEAFRPEAREVLAELLEKYAEHGISQLDDLRVLQVPPFNEMGSPVEIAGRFGGTDRLREAVSDLQELLYAA